MAALEFASFAALGLAAAWLVWRTESTLLRIAATLGLGAALVASLIRGTRAAPPEPIALERDAARAVGSGACRACHPSEFASWHRSFHRTMTQVATPATVLGPWDGTKLEVEGRSLELSRRGDELWARLPDPDLVAAAIRANNPEPYAAVPLVARRILLTTGSHHHQVYWVGGERGNELRLLPITYLIAEGRYVPRRDAFLEPPDAAPHAIRWNSNCIMCHATRGEPELDEARDVFVSDAVELGIACEACHGPGAAHVKKHANPLVRLATHLVAKADPSIVNPARLPAERASEVCGQCHAYFVPRDEDRWWRFGFSDFKPGDALERTRVLLAPDLGNGAFEANGVPKATGMPALSGASEVHGVSAPNGALVEAAAESLFWGDGTIRVGGRELNGLERSACFLRGHGERQISCLSCHSLHASDPDDQLRRDESIDDVCTRCHEREGKTAAEHTHHAANSAGRSCVACHMPFTSYALFTAIRSHRIDSPSALATATDGRPNACNLCHLDRSLGWTAAALAKWYGARNASAALGDETPRALVELLAGDAATRAVVAAAFGRPETLAARGAGWKARALAELLDDPYAAVRKVACDSLRRTAGFADFPCDFMAAAASRRAARDVAVERARKLLGDGAVSLEVRIRTLLETRDDRPTTISE
jgi:predicted CXXCH cytochrome family protein